MSGVSPHFLLADDHPLVRQGVMNELAAAFPGARFRQASSAAELFGQLTAEPADLLILDLSLPDRHGLECLAEIVRRWPGQAVLVLSMHSEQAFALRALDLGAMGYLTKDLAGEEVVQAARRVLAGRRYIGPELAELLAVNRQQASAPRHEGLSAREFRVLRELGRGTSLAVIAERLALSPKTVTTYRARLLTKLGLRNNAELVRYCLEHRLID